MPKLWTKIARSANLSSLVLVVDIWNFYVKVLNYCLNIEIIKWNIKKSTIKSLKPTKNFSGQNFHKFHARFYSSRQQDTSTTYKHDDVSKQTDWSSGTRPLVSWHRLRAPVAPASRPTRPCGGWRQRWRSASPCPSSDQCPDQPTNKAKWQRHFDFNFITWAQ